MRNDPDRIGQRAEQEECWGTGDQGQDPADRVVEILTLLRSGAVETLRQRYPDVQWTCVGDPVLGDSPYRPYAGAVVRIQIGSAMQGRLCSSVLL